MTATALGDPAANRRHLPHRLDGGIAERAAIGLIVLATDQTLEHEFRRLLDAPGIALYQSRILNDARITPETLVAMEARLVDAASLILPGLPLDVVAFGCTSASMVIGEERVFARLREARPGVACTTPITAAFAAFDALGVRRLALLTPYRDDIKTLTAQPWLKAGRDRKDARSQGSRLHGCACHQPSSSGSIRRRRSGVTSSTERSGTSGQGSPLVGSEAMISAR
jgi:hypothetical protein